MSCLSRTLASQGYIVAAPEVYHEFEPLGTPFHYNQEDTDKGNDYKYEKPLSAYDSDARALLELASEQRMADTVDRAFGEFAAYLEADSDFKAFVTARVIDTDARWRDRHRPRHRRDGSVHPLRPIGDRSGRQDSAEGTGPDDA